MKALSLALMGTLIIGSLCIQNAYAKKLQCPLKLKGEVNQVLNEEDFEPVITGYISLGKIYSSTLKNDRFCCTYQTGNKKVACNICLKFADHPKLKNCKWKSKYMKDKGGETCTGKDCILECDEDDSK